MTYNPWLTYNEFQGTDSRMGIQPLGDTGAFMSNSSRKSDRGTLIRPRTDIQPHALQGKYATPRTLDWSRASCVNRQSSMGGQADLDISHNKAMSPQASRQLRVCG
jgi:hypothetical protein